MTAGMRARAETPVAPPERGDPPTIPGPNEPRLPDLPDPAPLPTPEIAPPPPVTPPSLPERMPQM